MEFVEAPGFTALVADYLDDDEYRGLQGFLAGKPDAAMSCQALAVSVNFDGAIHDVARASVAASE